MTVVQAGAPVRAETLPAAVAALRANGLRVSAEIDTEATTLNSEKWDPEGQVVRSQTQTDDITNSSEARAGGGAAGVSANVPDKAPSAPETARRRTRCPSSGALPLVFPAGRGVA